ncbi:hypothetical protein KGF51_10600 [Clostridioides sp. ZZV14-6045]|uniref:hypothetical protein n=1 Tax=unclassified Clostridioides TaxID=2635829 RepID=UPI001D0FBC77|nr:hypothetical protein [Clostridioides sp. ZZV14-6045]MCC0730029.1 hypothetical protein [Clostridioides sp. ZZV14-6048]MCC0741746.1 hypothetical protein [Clostridioides sp. ZZV14-6044]HBY3283449.1 hypothetical protein [Clostridioides difficile]
MNDEIEIKFKIEGDKEGYVMFECPHCESEFKLNAEEVQSNNIEEIIDLYCPYCGLKNEITNFYTKEMVEQADELIENYYIEELNKCLKGFKKINFNNKTIKIKSTFRPLKKNNIKNLKTEEIVEEIFDCSNCNRHQKVLYCAGKSKVFCSYCGVDI